MRPKRGVHSGKKRKKRASEVIEIAPPLVCLAQNRLYGGFVLKRTRERKHFSLFLERKTLCSPRRPYARASAPASKEPDQREKKRARKRKKRASEVLESAPPLVCRGPRSRPGGGGGAGRGAAPRAAPGFRCAASGSTWLRSRRSWRAGPLSLAARLLLWNYMLFLTGPNPPFKIQAHRAVSCWLPQVDANVPRSGFIV